MSDDLRAIQQVSPQVECCSRCQQDIRPGMSYIAFMEGDEDAGDGGVDCCLRCFELLLGALSAGGQP